MEKLPCEEPRTEGTPEVSGNRDLANYAVRLLRLLREYTSCAARCHPLHPRPRPFAIALGRH